MKVYGQGWIEQKDRSKNKDLFQKWIIRFRTECGRKSKSFNGTYLEAVEFKGDLLVELLSDATPDSLLFKNYANKWLNWRLKNPDYSPNTLSRDKRIVKNLVHWFGDLTLFRITPPLIKDTISKFTSINGNKLSGTGLNMHFSELSTILKSAVDDGLMDENPMDKVKTPKRDTKEKRALSREQWQHMIDCLAKEDMDGRVVCLYLMLYLGLRIQEACVVYWDDIDFENDTLSINRAYKVADGSIGAPKSKAAKRAIPMPKQLTEILITWKSKLGDDYNLPYVCPTTMLLHMSPTAMRKWYARFCNRYNLESLSFHELRHTNLTFVASYMNEFDLQRYAGWSSIEPAKIYIHQNNDTITKAVNLAFSNDNIKEN